MITPPHGEAEVRALLGDIRVELVAGKRQVVSPKHWEERNCVVVRDLPGFEGRPLYVHRIVEPYLRAALTGCVARRPDYKIRTMGCFAPRPKRTRGEDLSLHSWAAAVDINADTNPLQRIDRGRLMISDIPAEWVEEFSRAGFLWGGHFRGETKDPMHWQFATGF